MESQDWDRLLARVREHVDLEVAADVRGLYAFIDPVRRAKREERDDEPEVTLSVIEEFVGWVRSASILDVELTETLDSDPLRGDRPSATVRVEIEYNAQDTSYAFTSVWVRHTDTWFTTSMGKIRPGPAILL